MAEKITYNIKNGHYAQLTGDTDGAPLFGDVKRWVGWSEMSLPPVGEKLNVHADGVIYYKAHVNQGYAGNVSAYQVPEHFRINHLGEYKDENGVLIEIGSSKSKDFALLGEFDTADDEAADPKRFVLYSCAAGRPDFSGSTKKETIEPALFSIPITASPLATGELVKATVLKSKSEDVFNAWFDSVYYVPAATAAYAVTITVNHAANPVEGALVVVGDRMARTGEDGKATFILPAGTYYATATLVGTGAAQDTVVVTNKAETKTLTLIGG